MAGEHAKYRLSLDIGTNSIGWCMFRLDQKDDAAGILRMGVRVFSDGRDASSGASLSEDRRLARQARRRRDRFLKRRKELMDALVAHGFMPSARGERKALETLDPYALRAKALDERLEPFEIGRALFHVNQRRGFKSNRKTDKGKDSGKIRPAIKRLEEMLVQTNARTLGEYLFISRQSGKATRFRPSKKGSAIDYAFYPQRSFAEHEFETIVSAQSVFHPGLKDAVEGRGGLRDIIFHQRPLKPVTPGQCTLNPNEQRAPRALPIAQRFRMLQDLNHLRVVPVDLEGRALTRTERDKLLAVLETGRDMSFDDMRAKLGLVPGISFTLETPSKTGLKGDQTARVLGAKKFFGPAWSRFAVDLQGEVVGRLLDEEDEEQLVGVLMANCGITEEKARAVAAAELPDGYARFCRPVLEALCREMEKEVIPYSEAVLRAGFHSHSDFYAGELLDRLPYYGQTLQRHITPGSGRHIDKQEERLGRVSNPTVHIALNQLRRVVNELIKDHGHPSEIILEVARDLRNGPDTRRAILDRQAELRKANDIRRERLQSLGVKVTPEALMRLRLWEELGREEAARRCPYTGAVISISRLLSDEVEIEHIIPFGRSLDDSPANKTVSLRQANRYKLNRTPFEAFGQSLDGYDWSAILERALLLPENKRWRFGPEAMERLERDGGFLDRQLADTQFISRLAREYLTGICDKNKVWVTPGRLTSLLAHAWGFPRKNRDDHRHHARDAAIIGVCTRSILKRVADHNAREVQDGVSRFLADLEQPWQGYREEVLAGLERIIVSHRPDHGLGGRLHNDTAYGVLDSGPDARKNAQHRVEPEKISSAEHLLAVKSRGIQARILHALTGKEFAECLRAVNAFAAAPEKEAKKAVHNFCGSVDQRRFRQVVRETTEKQGVRRLRIVETLSLIPVKDSSGKVYKGFVGNANAYYPVFLEADGRWSGSIVSRFEANDPDRKEGEQGRVVMMLHRGDMLEIEHNGRRLIVTVARLSEKQIALVEHFEANADKRNRERSPGVSPLFIYKGSPEALRKSAARPVHVSPAGKLMYIKVPRHADAGNSGK